MSQQTLEKLNNLEMIKKFNQTIYNIVASDSVGEAKELVAVLSDIFLRNPEFNKVNPSLYKIYYNYLVATKYVIIFDLEEEEIVGLIRENFDFVLNNQEYDLDRKMKYKIRGIIGLEKRDIFKKEIRQALMKCNNILSKNKILINEQKHSGTIANWLKDYYTKLGMEKVDSLKLNEYLVNSANIKFLSLEEKIKLKKLLDFFENMKVSSVLYPMFEESFVAVLPNKEISLMSFEKMEVMPPDILRLYDEVKNISNSEKQNFDDGNNIDELKKMVASYPVGSFERKAIEEEIKKLES